MRYRRTVSGNTAIYHCMSRTVNGEAFFDRREKEVLRKMIAQTADFSGVEVLTYCIMKNHFHVLVRVAPVEALPDAELVRRFWALYPKPTKYQAATAADVERTLAAGGAAAQALRAQLLARMGDVSQFMKTLKQRFSIWFNKTHDRFGPVWSDRFKSVLVEGKGFVLQTMAAYIDLNPVRAGLVADPKDYRFCGYAEAVAGDVAATAGIREAVFGGEVGSAKEALQSYRMLLFGKGGAAVAGKGAITREDVLRVLEQENGVLPISALLRCRIRYFTEGAILGSCEFVLSHAEAWQARGRRRNRPQAHPIVNGDLEMACISGCRGRIFS